MVTDERLAEILQCADRYARGELPIAWLPLGLSDALFALAEITALIDANVDESPTWLLDKLKLLVRGKVGLTL